MLCRRPNRVSDPSICWLSWTMCTSSHLLPSRCPLVLRLARAAQEACQHMGSSRENQSGMPAELSQGFVRPSRGLQLRQEAESQSERVPACPLGSRASKFSERQRFTQTSWQLIWSDHLTLLERIPAVQDFQCAWALLLHSASSWANFMEGRSLRNHHFKKHLGV